MAISLVSSYFTVPPNNTIPGTLTSPSFTPNTNEVLVLKVVVENSQALPGTPTATGGGITWTQRVSAASGNICAGAIWTGIVTSGGTAITVSVPISYSGAATAWSSMVIERWSNAQLAASPATLSYLTNSGTSTLTTTAANSIISYLDGDWNAVPPGTPVYASGAIQEGLDDRSAAAAYVGYFAYQTCGAAGSQTVGLTSPTGRKDTLLAIEIKDAGGATPVRRLMLMGVGM